MLASAQLLRVASAPFVCVHPVARSCREGNMPTYFMPLREDGSSIAKNPHQPCRGTLFQTQTMAALAAVRFQGRSLKANLSCGPTPKKTKADLKMDLIKGLPEKGIQMVQVEVTDNDLASMIAAGKLSKQNMFNGLLCLAGEVPLHETSLLTTVFFDTVPACETADDKVVLYTVAEPELPVRATHPHQHVALFSQGVDALLHASITGKPLESAVSLCKVVTSSEFLFQVPPSTVGEGLPHWRVDGFLDQSGVHLTTSDIVIEAEVSFAAAHLSSKAIGGNPLTLGELWAETGRWAERYQDVCVKENDLLSSLHDVRAEKASIERMMVDKQDGQHILQEKRKRARVEAADGSDKCDDELVDSM